MFAGTFKSTIVLSVVAFFAVANGVPTSGGASQCDTGEMKCCNEMVNSTSVVGQTISGLLGLSDMVLGSFGMGCTPIAPIGTGSGANCVQQPVCCNDVKQNGLVNIGCSPINL